MKAVLIAAFILAGCSSAPELKTRTVPPVSDHTALLPKRGLVSARIVPDHILDIAKVPGGSLGEYAVKQRKYQIFIIDAGTSQKAAFLLLDIRATLRNPEYIAYMGGYSGSDGTRDIYVFAKKQYLAGVVGLNKSDANPIAIELASRLN